MTIQPGGSDRLVQKDQMSNNCTMSKLVMPSRKEIHQAFLEGEEAVVALIEQTVGRLAERVQALEDQLAKNSRNSSKPPSGDGLKKVFDLPEVTVEVTEHRTEVKACPVRGETNKAVVPAEVALPTHPRTCLTV